VTPMQRKENGTVTVERMSFMFRVQHLLTMITLLVLAVTGFELMYHEHPVSRFLIELEGGVLNRGILHRVAAVALMAQLIFHAFYMGVSRAGRRELREFLLTGKDFGDFFQATRYNLGMAPEYPRFGKYGYKEKFQYWGATIGIFLISLTGVALWAEEFSMRFLPKFMLDLTLIVHGYQGLLIFLILLFWHLYIVHLHPSVFPMNRAWITGRVDAEWLREEHPLEYEKLKGEGVI